MRPMEDFSFNVLGICIYRFVLVGMLLLLPSVTSPDASGYG